jgi:hypothetical protein
MELNLNGVVLGHNFGFVLDFRYYPLTELNAFSLSFDKIQRGPKKCTHSLIVNIFGTK